MKVIAFYTNDLENRGPCYLSSKNKLDYIFSVFNSLNEKYEVLSLCTENKEKKRPCKNEEKICTVYYMNSYSRNNIITKILHLLFDPVKTFFFLIKHIKKEEVVYIYHSTAYYKIVKLIKKIKKFKMILEVEEVYGDVSKNEKQRKKEYDFFRYADAFVFPTELLNQKVNKENRPFVIIHGTYQVEEERSNNRFDDNENVIHCVYAGTLDPRKGGAMAAVSATQFLPENYHLHILGFGTEIDKKRIAEKIKDISAKSKAKVTYD